MTWGRDYHWRPRDATWRVAMSFIVGSLLFALGSFPPYSQRVAPFAVAVTFFVGSIAFTTAALGQLLTTPRRPGGGGDRISLLWWAAVVQLVGTVLFNISTFDATRANLDVHELNRLVWRPDMTGSVAFLLASHLVWLTIRGRSGSHDADWWGAVLTYGGSVLFMASAIAAVTLPTTGQTLNVTIVNTATFLGALGFLLAAHVSLPPSSDDLVRSG